MTTEEWRKIDEVLQSALDLPETERRDFLDQACYQHPGIRAEVEALLEAHAEASGFIESIVSAPVLSQGGPLTGLIGRRIGPYKLVAELGRGGMGGVYRAERDDQEFSQAVAVKVIASGTPPAAVLDHFRKERRILARLEHPHIARLLDGGVTADGLQYIIMEHIAGLRIDTYCARSALTVQQRLKLFQAVCSAIHFAHQNLVVHRDIKPNNILVTPEGVPKLLDFGIAKVLNADATQTMAAAMTPDYASPEQLRGDSVTTATDVYSLGVLLYELLAGRHPYQLTGKTFPERVRIVSGEEPEKPSAARRELAGDLDAIVLKAMRPEPRHRYASAEELSNDIGRYLAGFPVLARRGSLKYTASKFVARHKLAAAVSFAAVLLTLAGVAGIFAESRVANAERTKAQRRFNDVRKLAGSVLFELHDGIAGLPGSTPVRKLLATRALEYLDTLAKEAAGDIALQLELAAAYGRIGDVQGGPNLANLGDFGGAMASYLKAQEILERILAARPNLPEARIELSKLNIRLSDLHRALRDFPRAMDAAKAALSAWEAVGRGPGREEESARGRAAAHLQIAKIALASDHASASLSEFQKSLEIYEALLAAHPGNAGDQRNVALDHKYLCEVFMGFGDSADLETAASHAGLAVDGDRRRLEANPADARAKEDLAYSLSQAGTAYEKKGDLVNARRSLEESIQIRRALAEGDPRNFRVQKMQVYPHIALGEVLLRMGRESEAVSEYSQAIAAADPLSNTDPEIREWLARTHRGKGEAQEVLAKRSTVSSPSRLALHQAACASYRRAAQQYRENARRSKPTEFEANDLKEVVQALRSCSE